MIFSPRTKPRRDQQSSLRGRSDNLQNQSVYARMAVIKKIELQLPNIKKIKSKNCQQKLQRLVKPHLKTNNSRDCSKVYHLKVQQKVTSKDNQSATKPLRRKKRSIGEKTRGAFDRK